jgi:hypothetical protein
MDWDPEVDNLSVGEDLMSIAKTNDIKFVFGENHTIFHFNSDLSHSEVTSFLDLCKDDHPEHMYVLVQTTKDISSNMDPEHLEHLMSFKKKKGHKPKNMITNFLLDRIKENNTDEKYLKIYEKINLPYETNVCNLTIDEILDKITESGIDSLTTLEKNKLDEYSNEK